MLRPEPRPPPLERHHETGAVIALREPRGDDSRHPRDASPRRRGRRRTPRPARHSSFSAANRMRVSTSRRSWFRRSSSSATSAARASSLVMRSSSAASARRRRPAAFIRGPSRKPTARSSTSPGSSAAMRISARSPGRSVRASACSPSRASRRFSPRSGTRSHTVARPTRSRSALSRRRVAPGARPQRLGELVRHAGGAQAGERVGLERGVQDRACGQAIARAVMVGDDHVDARRSRRARPRGWR